VIELTKEGTFKRITNSDIYSILEEVRVEVKKTNGRVTRLEDMHVTNLSKINDVRTSNEKSIDNIWKVLIMAASVVGGFVIWLLNKLF
jgi:hypothetical protein